MKIRFKMAPLIQQREEALAAGKTSSSVAFKHEINKLQEHLEDLETPKAGIQAKLRVYEKNAPQAAKVRDKANAFWEEGRALIDEFVKMQSRARTLYQKALDLDNKISELEGEHLRLVGRDMRGPGRITNTVHQLGAFAAPNVADVKPLDAWQYVSDEQIAAQHKEELDKKLKAHEERIKIAEEHAPKCPNCARNNGERKMVVDRRSGGRDRPGQAGTGHSAHHWAFKCLTCGATMTEPITETRKK
jgi:hypothetical protein